MIGRAVRSERYRLVEWKEIGASPDTAKIELYDYETDPAETKNLAKEKPDVVAQLRAILAKQPEAKPQIRDDTATSKKAGRTGEKQATAGKSKQDREAMFSKRDKNNDGHLTREEFIEGQPDPEEAPKRFPLFDTNKDGQLSREEFVKGGRP
jgi:iduronate 2-sulfatase